MLYPSIYRAKAVSVTSTALTALVPQVFGDVAITVTDIIGTPESGMGWVFFQAGKADFPVWLGVTTTVLPGPAPEMVAAPQIWNWEGVSSSGGSLDSSQIATNDIPSESSEMYLARIDDSELDQSYQINTLVTDDFIYLQYAPDSSSWHRYRLLAAPVLSGDTWTFSVVTVDGSAPGTAPPVGEPVLVIFQPVGASIPGATYVHSQGVPSTVWVIDHDLGFYPNVSVVDSAGEQVEGEVDYISGTRVQVTFTAAFSGTAYLS
jgi:hypothetical protein